MDQRADQDPAEQEQGYQCRRYLCIGNGTSLRSACGLLQVAYATIQPAEAQERGDPRPTRWRPLIAMEGNHMPVWSEEADDFEDVVEECFWYRKGFKESERHLAAARIV